MQLCEALGVRFRALASEGPDVGLQVGTEVGPDVEQWSGFPVGPKVGLTVGSDLGPENWITAKSRWERPRP